MAFCPKQVLELDEKEKASVVKPDECTQCGLCELHCPDMAIAVRLLEQDEVEELEELTELAELGVLPGGDV